jgi:hypothetical protein
MASEGCQSPDKLKRKQAGEVAGEAEQKEPKKLPTGIQFLKNCEKTTIERREAVCGGLLRKGITACRGAVYFHRAWIPGFL